MRPLFTWRSGVFLLVVALVLYGLYRYYVGILESGQVESVSPNDSRLDKS
jgi:hypothetical protein